MFLYLIFNIFRIMHLVFFRWPSVVRPPLNGHTGGQLDSLVIDIDSPPSSWETVSFGLCIFRLPM